MVKKQRITATKARQRGKDSSGRVVEGKEGDVIRAAVWGQLEPLDRKAKDKIAKWGDQLPQLVSPDLAGRFEAAYEALADAVKAQDVMTVNQIVGQLLRAWDVLEQAAIDAGHKPLSEDCYCIEMEEGDVVCIARHGWVDLRKKHPTWTVYSFEDACRVLRADFTSSFIEKAYNSFPNAKIVSIKRDGEDKPVNWDIGDEIPW